MVFSCTIFDPGTSLVQQYFTVISDFKKDFLKKFHDQVYYLANTFEHAQVFKSEQTLDCVR